MHLYTFRRVACATLALALILPAAGCNGEEKIASQWTAGRLTVDGAMDDWNGLKTTYFEDQELVLGLANDSANLYLMIRFRDPSYARTIKGGGLTLYLDGSGKKDKAFKLLYRGGPEIMPQSPDSMPPRTRQFMESPRADSIRKDELICAVKDVIADKPIPLDGSEGPAVAAGKAYDFFIYELSIPLGQSGLRHYGIGASFQTPVMISMEWGGSSFGGGGRPRMEGGMTRPPEGMGPPGGGGSGPGGFDRPPDGGRNSKAMSRQEIWIKSTLATQ